MLNPMLGKKIMKGGGAKIFAHFVSPLFNLERNEDILLFSNVYHMILNFLHSQKRKAYCKFRKCTFFRDQVVLFIRD